MPDLLALADLEKRPPSFTRCKLVRDRPRQRFDEIFDRIKEEGLAYGSGPRTPSNMEINDWNGGRGVYFVDPNGHLLELLTRDYTAEQFAKQ